MLFTREDLLSGYMQLSLIQDEVTVLLSLAEQNRYFVLDQFLFTLLPQYPSAQYPPRRPSAPFHHQHVPLLREQFGFE
jgi:hypothetical protein